ncbi:C39 family peptidase [Intestinimonas butyriciproducens]|uniref:C39 family peptidase n=1 Tax=Intestinimonas butyriciproducens TaxID=1297617 RepID=UPI001AB04F2D|nr:C39 family peptidase [Intestinimonas butyriciproducens]MBO3280535.1 C39 family peptidase [Intestinimonas butyriciproducens]
MPEEQRTQGESAGASVKAAAKTGKAVSDIAKGAATGGAHGAALAAVKHSKKWIGILVSLLLLPILIVAMLPVIIFGSLFGTGTDTPSGITDDAVLTQNMVDLNAGISSILSEGLTDVLNRIDANFADSGCDQKEVNNPYGADVVFNANAFIAMYCASKDTDVESISQSDLESLLNTHLDKLYAFTYQDESREVEGEPDPETGEATTETITVRVYTITYNGESYFSDEIFHLSEEQKALSNDYAQNLSVFLDDGSYQVLSSTEFSADGLSYEGVVFTDGETQVVYYNQLDERWKNLPYGTDDIGGYACGPTSMSIVVSSLTSETIDPPHMAQWAYENGYWASKSGSYHTLIPGAASSWGLACEGCSPSEPQRIVDALADGKLVVALMTKGHFTKSGHFIVLRGVTSEGEILVADPASYQRSNQTWDLSIILNEASRSSAAGGPFWIIG